MPDLQKGYTFSGVSPNNSVTAEKLNTLVDSASILTSFYTGKTENSIVHASDLALIYDSTSGEYRKVQIGNLVPTNRAKTGFTNLQAFANGFTQISASADEIIMRSDAGGLFYAHGFSASATLTSYSGASTAFGRDATNVLANTWYYFWAIGGSGGSDFSLLLSTSQTSPTLPNGYLYKCLLGAVRVNSTSQFVRFTQRNLDVDMDIASEANVSNALLNPKTGSTGAEFTNVSPVTAKTLQTTDLSQCIPPNITARVRGIIGSTDTTPNNYSYAVCPAATVAIATTRSSPSDLLEGLQIFETLGFGGIFGFFNVATFDVGLKNSQVISWTAGTAVAKHSMRIIGYRLNL